MLKHSFRRPTPPLIRSEDPIQYDTRGLSTPSSARKGLVDARVSVVDFDLPFGSILKLMFKWTAAAFLVSLCFFPMIVILTFVVMAIFGS
jgi:hypothetical protein